MPKHMHVIEAESAEEFKARVLELAQLVNSSVIDAALEAPKRGRRTKAEIEQAQAAPVHAPPAAQAAPQAEVQPEEASTEDLFGGEAAEAHSPPPPAKEWTTPELQAILKKVVDKHGLPKAKEVMLKFAPQVPKMTKEQHAPFVAACQALL